ncbi:GGDEF domain-containing protein [Methylorubrum salsuginis]|uniref:diguanylate cyclase n=1 Tax=Methylorubrum salsuginis TaxID=414703 RepID=A0A1I4EMI8_9HYPH|nr:GGDEF domain-containing protein [Methylorubrum salsuginis]SFL06958.1 diguanylate cyclase (GGDEF) domain-containing protein [Methylorubrum salsuginis]
MTASAPPPDPASTDARPGPARRLFGRSLAARLLRVILGCYLVVAVAVTGAQVAMEYRSAHRRLEADVRAMERTFGEGLADALWNFNKGVLRGILRGVDEMPVVTGVEVRDEHGGLLESVGGSEDGQRWPSLFDRPFERRFDLVYYDENRRPHRVGHWIVRSNDGIALDQVKETLIVILINSLLKTLALLAIFSIVVHRMVGRPLAEIAGFVTQLDIRTLGDRPLQLRSRGNHELHLLAGVFNLMTARLRRAFDDNAVLLRDLQEANATLQARVEERTRDLERLAVTDPLTGLGNRRALDEALAKAVREEGAGLSLILADIDHFKAINDRHGHAVGDAVLVALAAALGAEARAGDRLGRWGGEEFVILCPATGLAEAQGLAEAMRRRVAETELPGVGQRTCSFGVAERIAGESADGLLARADAALYAAKHNGRDRVETADADPAFDRRSAA